MSCTQIPYLHVVSACTSSGVNGVTHMDNSRVCVLLSIACDGMRLEHKALLQRVPLRGEIIEAHGVTSVVQGITHYHDEPAVLILETQPRRRRRALEEAGWR